MIDVRRNDGSAARDLVAHELRRDESRDRRAPTLAGMLLTGYSGQAYLGMGDSYLFTSIAAVAIGGASILGGSGHYIGTVAGALVLTILSGLLPALNLSSGALLIVYGAVILATVFATRSLRSNVVGFRIPSPACKRPMSSR